MSEYQCYEFLALDRPISARERSELRAISTRAEISPTRFWNEYQWGDLKADPAKLLARYFDAFLYFANWGSRRLMLRLPADRVDLRQMKPYFRGDCAKLTRVRKYVVIDLWSDTEEPEDEWFDGSRLGVLTPIRAELLASDMSAAYLAWLLAVQSEELSGSAKEPAVPAGLRGLSAPLSALVEFLRIDQDLMAAAKEASDDATVDATALRTWLESLPLREKNRWLARAVEDPGLPIGIDLVAAFRRQRPAQPKSRRTVSQLLARAEQLRLKREQAEDRRAAARERRTRARRRSS